jgi:hypothetical protein
MVKGKTEKEWDMSSGSYNVVVEYDCMMRRGNEKRIVSQLLISGEAFEMRRKEER